MFFGTKGCLAPEGISPCEGKIVRAHTIQRSGHLERIAEDGTVLQFQAELAPKQGLPKIAPASVGIRKASTFTGFCGKHDAALFRALDTIEFSATPKQSFLLLYRAFCRELYIVRAQQNWTDVIRDMDRGFSEEQQISVQQQANLWKGQVKTKLERGMRYKEMCDQVLTEEQFERVAQHSIFFEGEPTVLCSGVTTPRFDFSGTRLQRLDNLNVDPHVVAFSLITLEGGFAASFAWLDDSDFGKRMIQSLRSWPSEYLADLLLRFAFSQLENVYFARNWWEALSDPQQEQVQRIVQANLPGTKTLSDILRSTDAKLGKWTERSVVSDLN